MTLQAQASTQEEGVIPAISAAFQETRGIVSSAIQTHGRVGGWLRLGLIAVMACASLIFLRFLFSLYFLSYMYIYSTEGQRGLVRWVGEFVDAAQEAPLEYGIAIGGSVVALIVLWILSLVLSCQGTLMLAHCALRGFNSLSRTWRATSWGTPSLFGMALLYSLVVIGASVLFIFVTGVALVKGGTVGAVFALIAWILFLLGFFLFTSVASIILSFFLPARMLLMQESAFAALSPLLDALLRNKARSAGAIVVAFVMCQLSWGVIQVLQFVTCGLALVPGVAEIVFMPLILFVQVFGVAMVRQMYPWVATYAAPAPTPETPAVSLPEEPTL